MGKNKEMLKCFYKVMINDEGETNKILPDMYEESFYTIDEEFLLTNNINNLILDIDGTLLEVDSLEVSEKLINRIKTLKNKNINMCLVSNNNIDRVKPVAKKLNINYLADAHKPLKEAFDKALEILNTKDKTKVAMVGDQMMSDIKGAKEYGIYTILVKPVSKHNNIQTGTSRFMQNIMENHLQKQKKFDKNKYYKKGRR
mgnify:CR=1 FL=1